MSRRRALVAAACLLTTVGVTLYASAGPRKEPAVTAGPDQVIEPPRDWVMLHGRVQGLRGRRSVEWSVRDAPPAASVALRHADHLVTRATFSGPGTYLLRLTVTQGARVLVDEVSVVVEGAGVPPVAGLVADPPQGEAPRTVLLDASGSSDPDGAIVSYRFDFGDGTAPLVSSSPTATHRYDAAGSYTAAVTVTDDDGLSDQATAEVRITPNPLQNGDFEAGAGGLPLHWSTGSFAPGVEFAWEQGAGIDGSAAVRISNSTPNDAWWEQRAACTPGTPYNLHGWIRGEGIAGGPAGASLGVVRSFVHSDDAGSTGTFPYRRVSVTFLTDATGQVDLGFRLGLFGSTVTGTAWADALELTSDDFAPRLDGLHLHLWLERDDLARLSPDRRVGWVEELDAFYEALGDLVGGAPFGGASVGVLSVRQFPGGLAVAGNPIRWQQRHVEPILQQVEDQGDWSFALTHELGHVFDLDGRWVWNGEFSAAFKQYFGVEVLDARVIPGGRGLYQGVGLEDLYRELYDAAVGSGGFSWAAVVYRFIQIAHTIGWDAFRATYRHFGALAPADVPATPLGKFELFLDRLSVEAGMDVRSLFFPFELTWIRAELS